MFKGATKPTLKRKSSYFPRVPGVSLPTVETTGLYSYRAVTFSSLASYILGFCLKNPKYNFIPKSDMFFTIILKLMNH